MGNIIEINNLSKSFKDANILRNINLVLKRAKLLVLSEETVQVRQCYLNVFAD